MTVGAGQSTIVPPTYRFGRHILDVSHRTLLTDGQRRSMPEKLFQVLLLLLEADGEIVLKESFSAVVWQHEEFSGANLAQHVFLLRALIGERAGENAYIVTVPGLGYRLATNIEKKVGLSMKGTCERCSMALNHCDVAYICSYECTFCGACATRLNSSCPNCGGILLQRPYRNTLIQDSPIDRPPFCGET